MMKLKKRLMIDFIYRKKYTKNWFGLSLQQNLNVRLHYSIFNILWFYYRDMKSEFVSAMSLWHLKTSVS